MNDRGMMHGGILANDEPAMERTLMEREGGKGRLPSRPALPRDSRWDLAFLGILGYLVVEYMRLSAHYPVLMPFQVGKVAVGVSFLGWLMSSRREEGDRSFIRAIDITFVLLLLGAGFSVLFANDHRLAWSEYSDLLRWGLIYFLLGRIVNSSWRFRIFIFLFLLLNLKLAQHSIRYFYAARDYYHDEMAVVIQGAGAGSTGFFSNSADLGVAMCVAWPIATILLFARTKMAMRIFLAACSAVILGSILVCGSRGAVVGAACVAIAGAIMTRKKVAALVMAVILLLGVLYMLPGASKERFRSALHPETDKTAHSRLVFWKAGLEMFEHNPLVGVGMNNFAATRLEDYANLGFASRAWVAHSLYIQVLSEQGLAGMIPWLALVVLFFRLNAKTRKILLALGKERRSSYEYLSSIGLDLGLIGYLSSGAFVAVFIYPHLWVLLGLSVALHTACRRIERDHLAREGVPAEQTAHFEMAAP
jgi:O-antigen ligase